MGLAVGNKIYTWDSKNKKFENTYKIDSKTDKSGVTTSRIVKADTPTGYTGNLGNGTAVMSAAPTSSTKTLDKTFDNTYDVSDYVNSLVGTGNYGASGGYYTLDIGNMLKAYEQQAEADRAVAKQTYDTARNDLLTSLKRFQDDYNTSKDDLATALNRYREQNALDVKGQQKDYLSNQALLEAAMQQADRQNRISAAARGIGGSGLQQLAQLQTLLNQGQNISNLATENQTVMDALRTALANKEEDTTNALEKLRREYTNKEEDINTNLNNILNTYNNALNSINANLATSKANAEVQRANSYIPYSPGSSGITVAEATSYGNDVANQLSRIVASYKNSKNAYKGTDKYVTYADALDAIRSLDISQNSAAYKKAVANLGDIYKSKHNGKTAPNL